MTTTSAYDPGGRPRRLERSRRDRWLTGVCGGLGDHFGVDPVIVRLVAIALVFAGGVGVIAYVAAVLLVPDEGSQRPIVRTGLASGGDRPWVIAGAVLLGIGAICFLDAIDFGFGWGEDVLWSLLLIAGGAYLLLRYTSLGRSLGLDLGPQRPPGATSAGVGPTAAASEAGWPRASTGVTWAAAPSAPTEPAAGAGAAPTARTEAAEGPGAVPTAPTEAADGTAAALTAPMGATAGTSSAPTAPLEGDERTADGSTAPTEAIGATAWPPPGPTPTTPLGGPTPGPTAPFPLPAPRARRPRATRLALGAVLVIVGLGGVLLATGVLDLATETFVAASVIVMGAALVVGAWRGGSPTLVGIGLATTAVLGNVMAVDVELDGGVGDRIYRPASASTLQDRYRLGVGRLWVDLRTTDLPPGTTRVETSVGVGELTVVVPDDVRVEASGRADIGDLRLLGREGDGTDVEQTVADAGSLTESARRVLIDAEVGVGEVRVYRASDAPSPDGFDRDRGGGRVGVPLGAGRPTMGGLFNGS